MRYMGDGLEGVVVKTTRRYVRHDRAHDVFVLLRRDDSTLIEARLDALTEASR